MHGTIEGGLALRDTVADIVRKRDRAMELYGDAHDALGKLAEAIAAAHAARHDASPARLESYTVHLKEEESAFLHAIKVPDRDFYLAQARKLTDASVWSHIIGMTDLERLMDKKAKDEFRQQLLIDPPPADVETITATLERFMAESGTIFRRGIAECFSNLDRRFRSHDGWKIGSRVILDHAFSDSGSWNYHRNHEDSLRDIERTFLVLDGKRMPESYASIVATLRHKRSSYGRQQTFVENDYFRIRCWMNGNAHIWFKRDDLLRKVNKLLAEYYGEVIPEDREPDADTGLNDPKTSLAKNYGFFPTPDRAAKTAMDLLPLWHGEDPPLRLLEPSAGNGNLARLAVTEGCIVDCVELHAERSAALIRERIYANVHQLDFLALRPEATGLYDRVIMNPPFDRERDVDHVMHALKFLKPDGCLVAIMSAGTEFRDTRKSNAFREVIAKMHGKFYDLPAGSFSSVGTNINTLVLKVRKDGRTFWR